MSEFSREDLDGLLELQQTDSRIRRLRHQLDDLPEQRQLEEAEHGAEALDAARGDLGVELDKVGGEQRQLDGEVELLRTRLEAEQARMYGGEITNPRELQSLRAEIDSTQRRVSEHEDQLLEVMARQEDLQGRADELTGKRAEMDRLVESATAARDEAAKGLLAELAELEVERDRRREGLPEALLTRYDDAVSRTRGAAVGELRDGMCTACRIELPAVEYQELFTGPPLTTCPECRRLVVVRG